MPIAHLIVPYIEEEGLLGKRRRRVEINRRNEEIFSSGGYWSECELPDGTALVRVRASVQLISDLYKQYQQVVDPTKLPASRHRSLDDLELDVYSEQRFSDLKRQAEAIVARLPEEGKVILPGGWTPENARLLQYLGSQGIKLDEVSTGTFPTTGILDTFASVANWASADGTGAVGTAVANQWAWNTAPYIYGYYTPATFGPDSEAYTTIVTVPGGNGSAIGLNARLTQVGAATIDGYTVAYIKAAGTDTFQIAREDNSVDTPLGADMNQEVASGDSIGIETIGTSISAYYRSGAGAWALLGSRTDGTYTTAGRLGAQGSSGDSTVLDNFGGGTVTAAASGKGATQLGGRGAGRW